MIQIISLLIILAIVVYLFIQFRKVGINKGNLNFKSFFTFSFKNGNKIQNANEILIRVTVLLFAILFLSSFLPTFFTGSSLSGLFLIVHITVAPIFAICLASIVLLNSHKSRMFINDFKDVAKFNLTISKTNTPILKLLFWLFVFFSIPLLVSIILILYPILGSDLQNFYIFVHRVSAVLFSITIIFIIYFYVIGIKVKNNSNSLRSN